MKARYLKRVPLLLLPVAALALSGCFTMPNADVQPPGQARLIQSGVMVESTKCPATVQAVDSSAGTITLTLADGATSTYPVGPKVKNLGKVQAGNQVKVNIEKELAVYLLIDGRLPDGSTAASLGINAKVLLVDPSYRLLTLEYLDSSQETFKPGIDTKLLEMAPGDSVAVKAVQVTRIRIE